MGQVFHHDVDVMDADSVDESLIFLDEVDADGIRSHGRQGDTPEIDVEAVSSHAGAGPHLEDPIALAYLLLRNFLPVPEELCFVVVHQFMEHDTQFAAPQLARLGFRRDVLMDVDGDIASALAGR